MNKNKVLLIPAAGLASRLRPLTTTASKAMLPINGKPVIAYILDQNLVEYDKIIVVYGKSDDLPDFIRSRYATSMHKIWLVKQENQTGVLSAVLNGLKCYIPRQAQTTESLTVWLGDTIVTDYKSKFITNEVVVATVSDWSRWCLVDDSITYYDKPVIQPPTDKALVGIYTFIDLLDVYLESNSIINSGVKVKGEFQMSQLLDRYKHCTKLVQTNEWYDCGDFHSIYESKAALITKLSRPDNKITIDIQRSSVTKSGDRCKNEIFWYYAMEDVVCAKPYLPQLYSKIVHKNICQYTIAYCPGSTLQEVFAFENLKVETVQYTLKRVLDAYFDCFSEVVTEMPKDKILQDLVESKVSRVLMYGKKYDFVSKDSVLEYVKYADAINSKLHRLISDISENTIRIKEYGHGDFHFGNILFDYNTGAVKFIDPKGPETKTIELYDLAKFYQSFYGDYLWIMTDTVVDQKLKSKIIEYCDKYLTDLGYDVSLIKQLVPVLEGSILKFHTENTLHQQKIWNKTQELINNENRVL